MNWMIKNSHNKPDGMWTLTVASFAVCTVLILASIFSGTVKVGDVEFTLAKVDPTLYAAYLAATFTSYVVRRKQKATEDNKVTDQEQ